MPAPPERFGDEKRPVEEVAMRREHVDGDSLPGKVAKREHRLETRDAGARDEDAEPAHGPSCAGAGCVSSCSASEASTRARREGWT